MKTSLVRNACGCCLIVSALLFQGCKSTPKAHYPTATVGASMSLDEGTVITANPVVLDGTESWVGAVAGISGGGAVGGTLGADISGTSTGASVGAAGGAIIGGIVGPKIEKAMTSKAGQELTIQLDDGGLIVVVQELREPAFYDGERVRIHINSYGHTFVYHSDEDPYTDPGTAVYLSGEPTEVLKSEDGEDTLDGEQVALPDKIF